MTVRDKAKLRVHGWAGECTEAELEYIRDWLERHTGKHVTQAQAQAYANGE